MKKVFLAILFTVIIFVLGIWAYFFISDSQKGVQHISGVVQYHTPDFNVSADPPAGYYIESSAIGMVYIQSENISDYLGETINASGSLKEICGNDGGSCFPMIKTSAISVSPPYDGSIF